MKGLCNKMIVNPKHNISAVSLIFKLSLHLIGISAPAFQMCCVVGVQRLSYENCVFVQIFLGLTAFKTDTMQRTCAYYINTEGDCFWFS